MVMSKWYWRWSVYIVFMLTFILLISEFWLTSSSVMNRNISPHSGECGKLKILENTRGKYSLETAWKISSLTDRTGDSEKIADQWQPVAATRDVFVFAAYFEKSYSAAVFFCPLGGSDVPTHVSLADTPHLNSSLNVLTVHIRTLTTPQYNLTSCVSPLFINPTHPSRNPLVEWFETNMLLGVELFTVYVHSIYASDMKILKYYESIKKVEIVNWTLAEDQDIRKTRPALKQCHAHGQLAALNDCLLRNKGRSAFTMATDVDELIIPTNPQDFTIMDLIGRLPNHGIYSFRHCYHHTDTNHTAHPKVKHTGISVEMLDHFQRSKEIKGPNSLSKMIYKPYAVFSVDVHTPHRTINKTKVHTVNPKIGFMHHYRKRKKSVREIQDKTTEKYLDKVLANMESTLTAIGKE